MVLVMPADLKSCKRLKTDENTCKPLGDRETDGKREREKGETVERDWA